MVNFSAAPYNLQNGQVADATQVMANFNQIITNGNDNVAENGVNSSITALLGLTIPISPSGGGSAIFIGSTGAGTANAQTIATLIPNNFTLTAGYLVIYTPSIANTSAATLAVNSTAATSVKRQANGGLVALGGGELQPLQPAYLYFDGTQYVLLNPAPDINITMGLNSTPPPGRLVLNGDSIAKTSGGTFNGTIYGNLYAYLWNNCSSPSANTVAPVTGGLGASAAADFAANKKITMPTGADFSPYGVGSLISQAGATGGSATVAAAGSVSGTISINALNQGNLPSGVNLTIDAVGGKLGDNVFATGPVVAGVSTATAGTGSFKEYLIPLGGSSTAPTGSMSASFTGSGTSVVQPVFGIYYYINY